MNTRETIGYGPVIHWMWLWTLTAIVVLFLMGQTLGQSLPPLDTSPTIESAQPMPMPNVDDPDSFLRLREPRNDLMPPQPQVEEILLKHEANEHFDAIEGWRSLRLDHQSRTWSRLGIAVAYYRLGMLNESIENLELSLQLDDTNAVAHYMLGLALLDKSEKAPLWCDLRNKSVFQLADFNPSEWNQTKELELSQGTPGSNPGFCELIRKKAQKQLELAIQHSQKLDLEQEIKVLGTGNPMFRLASIGSRSGKPVVTVDQLIVSLELADFLGQSHYQLGKLQMHGDDLLDAENSFDRADELGIKVAPDYIALASRMRDSDQPVDACRVYLKAMPGSPETVELILQRAMETLLESDM